MTAPEKKFENHRRCPSCQQQVNILQLSVYGMPSEQFFIPWLNRVNEELGYSLRTHGQTQLNELQFLCFTHICPTCGHISWWDMAAEELRHVLDGKVEGIGIKWTARPEALDHMISIAKSEDIKKILQIFKNEVQPPKQNEQQ